MYIEFLVLLVILTLIRTDQINSIKAQVWGPGLNPKNIILPARYVFLQTYLGDTNYKNNKSLEFPIDFKVSGRALDQERSCRVWANVLDRKDGSYILRYRLYEPCLNMRLIIKYNDYHLGESPYLIEGKVLSENCNCPDYSLNEWLDKFECGESPKQMEKHFMLYKDKILMKEAKKNLTHFIKPDSISLCNYIIKSNNIYRKCYGKYVGFKMFMDSILLSLVRKMKFPDMEFFVNLGDWPLSKEIFFPVISWCGSHIANDWVLPTYDLTEAALENMGRVILDMLSVQGNTGLSWEKRIPKVFWRGRDSNENRLKLIDISRRHPDLFNVSITNFFFYRDKQDIYGPKSDHVSFYKFFDYKYEISIDGTVAAYRFPYLLAGGSLVFKQDSHYYEHFYDQLIPYKHYIPLKKDLSDLVQQIKWALENDDEAKKIAENARQFANKHLLPKDVYCYHVHFLKKYAEWIVSDVNLDIEGMEHVPQPEESLKCDCTKYKRKEEL